MTAAVQSLSVRPSVAVSPNATTAMLTTQAAQQVQVQAFMAQQFPRNERACLDLILSDCEDEVLAERSQYEYPRGGEKVAGPSIRLAEAIARRWKHLNSGVIELGQTNGESQVMAYAWDMENNSMDVKIFTVPHVRYSNKDGRKALGDDPRDVYETVANMGARRKRACILAMIPGKVVEEAQKACDATLAQKDKKTPLEERIKLLLEAFAKFEVTAAMIEERIGHKLEAITESEFAKLRRVYQSINDGFAKPAAFFGKEEAAADGTPAPAESKGMFAGAAGAKQPPAETTAAQTETKAPAAEMAKAADSTLASGATTEPKASPTNEVKEGEGKSATDEAAGGRAEQAPAASIAGPDRTQLNQQLAQLLQASEVPLPTLMTYLAEGGFVSKAAVSIADIPDVDIPNIIAGWNAVSKILQSRLAMQGPAKSKRQQR